MGGIDIRGWRRRGEDAAEKCVSWEEFMTTFSRGEEAPYTVKDRFWGCRIIVRGNSCASWGRLTEGRKES